MSPVLVNFLSLTIMENVLISINYSQKLISIRESICTVINKKTMHCIAMLNETAQILTVSY